MELGNLGGTFKTFFFLLLKTISFCFILELLFFFFVEWQRGVTF